MSSDILVPEMGESVLEATVSHWYKAEGEFVKTGEVLVELETDKVNLEVGAKTSGVLKKIMVPVGEDVQVGDVLGTIDEAEEPYEKKTERESEPAPKEEQETLADEREGKKVSPVAAKMAKEKDLDLSNIEGSGPKGKVMKADVEAIAKEGRREKEKIEEKPEEIAVSSEVEIPDDRREERNRMSRRRRTIAQRLVEAQHTTAMLTTFNDIDMSAVMDLRKRRNEDFRKRFGIKLGITSFFIKAAVSALKAFPRLNAEIEGEEIILKHYYDIGVAIGAEEGLVVPVIRNADQMSFAEIEQQIRDYVQKSNAGKLAIEDLRGGTFSITNGGVYGSMLSTPIINPPQVGILGLHRIEERPVGVSGQIVLRPMMYAALSYDHRIVDGREAVQFLVHIKEMIEDPGWLLVES